jgi:CRP-like cAMP-binding protein
LSVLIENQSEYAPLVRRKFNRGEFLMRQNESSRYMYVLQSGNVRVFREQSGYVIPIEDLGPGDIVGEMALLDSETRCANVLALSDVEVTVITPQDFDEVIKKIPPWFSALARSIVFRLRSAIQNLEREPETYLYSSVVSLLIFKTVDKEQGQEFERNELLKEFATILRVNESKILDQLNRLNIGKFVKLTYNSISIPNLGILEKLLVELQSKQP